eukprot:UN03829
MHGANLREAQMHGADISATNLQSAVLQGVSLQFAKLSQPELGVLSADRQKTLLRDLETTGLPAENLEQIRSQFSNDEFDGNIQNAGRHDNCIDLSDNLDFCTFDRNDLQEYAGKLAEYLQPVSCEDEHIASGLWLFRLQPEDDDVTLQERTQFAITAVNKLP